MTSSASSSVLAEVTHQDRSGVLVIRLVGRAGINVLMDHIMTHLDDWVSHDRLLYDFTGWNVDCLSTEAFRQLPVSFAPVHDRRRSARAALIIQPHLEELAKILIALYESEELPVELAYFFDEDKGRAWLSETEV